jgi:serine/threonine-protein kinase
VALKILKPALSRNPARLAQFRREADRGGRLVGPSLLPVYELSNIDGHHFMSMPYVEGISLREVIRCRLAHFSGGVTDAIHDLVMIDEPEYLRAMTCILARATRAMARAHDQWVAHRDIKPANILLCNQGTGGVYLCDFGLGRDLKVATPEQMRDGAGTPMYMAPERLMRSTANEIKCDIYSMGVTLFEALTLVRPFQVPRHVTLLALPTFLAGAAPRRVVDVRPGFPAELAEVIVKAMARDASRRHDSAHQLAADLERIAGGPSRRRPRRRDCAQRPRDRRMHLPAESSLIPIQRIRAVSARGSRLSASNAAGSGTLTESPAG